MKLFLSHASVINQEANTSFAQNTLSIFTNTAEDYDEVVAILQKSIDAIKKLGAEGKKLTRRINIVLSSTPIKARQSNDALAAQAAKAAIPASVTPKHNDNVNVCAVPPVKSAN